MHKAIMILKALDQGMTVRLGQYTCCLGYDKKGRAVLSIIGTKESNGASYTIYLPWDISLRDFLDLCNSIEDEAKIILAANIVLNETKASF